MIISRMMKLQADVKFCICWALLIFVLLSKVGLIKGYGCGSTVQLQYGQSPTTIASPYYHNNMYCGWTVIAPYGERILVHFTSFGLEGCCDYVQLNRNHGYNGHSIPNDYYTTNNQLEILFTTDGSVTDAGFQLQVSVDDITSPEITGCPDDMHTTIELGDTNVPVTWIEPTASDSSGTIRSTESHRTGAGFSEGVTTVRYTFADDANNEAVCSFSVTVVTVDTIPPIVEQCPTDINTLFGRYVTWIEPTASDISNSTTWTSTAMPGIFITAPTKVAYTFSDSSDNHAYCNFTINVVRDTTPPIISNCPSDIQSSIEVGEKLTPVFWQKPTARDQAGRVILTDFTHLPSQLFPIGTTSVVYTFADDSFNLAFCNFTVVVHQVDTTMPTIHDCPTEITEDIEMGTSSIAIDWPPPTAFDLSGNVSLVSQNHFPGEKFTEGRTRVLYTFADGSHNVAFCQFDINIKEVDTTPPFIDFCPENIVETIEAGETITTVSWREPEASDMSGNVTISSESTIPSTFIPFAENIVKYVFNDDSGNQNSCQFSVSFQIVDTMSPVVTGCPDSIRTTSEIGTSGARVSWSRPFASDASTIVVSRSSHEPGDTFSVGLADVVYTFEDDFGNKARCIFSVRVDSVDSIPPEIITCPTDISDEIELGDGDEFGRIYWSAPEVIDKSGNVSLAYRSHQPGNVFPVGVTDVSYLYTDGARNQAFCNFSVTLTVADTKAPDILQCPTNIAHTIEAGLYGLTVFWNEPIVDDASGNVSLLIQTSSSGDVFPVGKTSVIYLFTDPSKNLATCRFIVTIAVVDSAPPVVFNCPGSIRTTSKVGTFGAIVSWPRPFATDYSAIILSSASHQPGESLPVGSTDIAYVFEDEFGNLAYCNFSVRVENVDTTPPTITYCPSNIATMTNRTSSGTKVYWKEPSASALSGNPSLLVQTHAPGSTFPSGSTLVTYIFKDDANNFASCVFSVTLKEAMAASSSYDSLDGSKTASSRPHYNQFRLMAIVGIALAVMTGACFILLVIYIWKTHNRKRQYEDVTELEDHASETSRGLQLLDIDCSST